MGVMTRSVEELLKSFEQLPEAEKRELASSIAAADQIFLQLEKEESTDE